MCTCKDSKSLDCLRQTLEQEFGVFEGLAGHRQKQAPFMKRLTTDTSVKEYIAKALEKPVTRGRLTNIGENNLIVRFFRPWNLAKPTNWDITRAVEATGSIGDVELVPGEAFPITFPFEALEVIPATTGETVRLQVFGQ